MHGSLLCYGLAQVECRYILQVYLELCDLFNPQRLCCFTLVQSLITPVSASAIEVFSMNVKSNDTVVVLGMGSANERRHYNVTSSLIGRAHPCLITRVSYSTKTQRTLNNALTFI